jgi:ATP-binding cassette subfamily B protein
VEFKNLTFSFPDGERAALTDVSFKIAAGERIGIVGKTGAGKTAIVDLLLRIYNISDGMLYVDGVDVNKIPIRQLRGAIAYVPQDNFLFSDTIKNNIGFFTDDAPIDEVRRVAELADVDENIIEFSKGYETVLGERGVTVSGGQKQRISIARALLKDAPILILDDSVSAVDTKTEQKILQNLEVERKGKTTIIIAHRITTVEGLDKIVYVDDGRVSAVGTHAELCETCAEYRRMVELQRLEEEGGEANV